MAQTPKKKLLPEGIEDKSDSEVAQQLLASKPREELDRLIDTTSKSIKGRLADRQPCVKYIITIRFGSRRYSTPLTTLPGYSSGWGLYLHSGTRQTP